MKEMLKKILYILFLPLSDKMALRIAFPMRTGEKLDLEKPKTYNQKLQWYKLFYRDPLMIQGADKYRVRDYIQKKGYGHLLNELYGVYGNAKDIDFSTLPNEFVLKTTNAMGTNILIPDKTKVSENEVKKQLNQWLKKKPLQIWFGREWAYEKIKPQIICEEYIDSRGFDLTDYKIHCFNGEPEVIQVSLDRESDLRVNYFDKSWSPIEARQTYPNKKGVINKPQEFDQMLDIARELSKDFPYVRVDLYNIQEKIIFGELTFYSSAGFSKFKPKEFNNFMGNLFKLPEKRIK